MDLSSNFRMLALYNQRMNKQLLAVCEQLSSEQLNKETNSFFPTIMAYWNHILFGDLIMLTRLINNGLVNVDLLVLSKLPVASSANDTFASNLKDLRLLRSTVDEIYVTITQSFTSEICSKVVRYITTEGDVLEKTVGEFCQHIFNHQTHHRGQLTCILSQFGLDFGCTDLPAIVPEGASLNL
jgi:uncharacterized damage-inducible protein DinB